MARLCKNGWIVDYLDYMKHQESPIKFHLWCSFFAISCALGRNCYIKTRYFNIYPNLYVCLLAGSGTCRKSTASDILVYGFLENAGIEVTAQKITDISIIQTLQTLNANGNSEMIIYNDELATLLDERMREEIIYILTALYTCKSKWTYKSVNRATQTLKNTWINLLVCSTPSSIQKCITMKHAKEGFLSRLVFVYEEEGNKKPIFGEIMPEELALKDNLIHDLMEIKNLKGEFTLTKEAQEWVEEWYLTLDAKSMPIELEGYMGRKHDLLLKLSMLLSAGLNDNMIIDEKIVQSALGFVEENEASLLEVYEILNSSEKGALLETVLKIIKKHPISHTDLMRRLSRKINKQELDLIVETLLASNLVEVKFNNHGGRTYSIS